MGLFRRVYWSADFLHHLVIYRLLANTRWAVTDNHSKLYSEPHQPVIGLIVGLHPDNERRRYFVTTPLIGWAQPRISPAVMSVSRFSPSMYAGKCSFVLKAVEGWYLIHHLNTHQANSDIEWLRFLQWQPMVVTMFDKSIFINSIHTGGSKYQINNANYFRCLISILYSVPQAYLLLPWWTLYDHQTLRMKRS